jgi:hypothetical protein
MPGFGSLLVARGGEAILRSSLFRTGYELFYSPMPAAEKRAAKSIIDVGFDRLGDAVGGGLVRLAVVLVPAAQSPAILLLGALCSAGAIYAASRMNRGYIGHAREEPHKAGQRTASRERRRSSHPHAHGARPPGGGCAR